MNCIVHLHSVMRNEAGVWVAYGEECVYSAYKHQFLVIYVVSARFCLQGFAPWCVVQYIAVLIHWGATSGAEPGRPKETA